MIPRQHEHLSPQSDAGVWGAKLRISAHGLWGVQKMGCWPTAERFQPWNPSKYTQPAPVRRTTPMEIPIPTAIPSLRGIEKQGEHVGQANHPLTTYRAVYPETLISLKTPDQDVPNRTGQEYADAMIRRLQQRDLAPPAAIVAPQREDSSLSNYLRGLLNTASRADEGITIAASATGELDGDFKDSIDDSWDGNQVGESNPIPIPIPIPVGIATTQRIKGIEKWILRRMSQHTRQCREQLVQVLQRAGFTEQKFEHACCQLHAFNDVPRTELHKHKPEMLVRKFATARSIYSYILRDTLSDVLAKWDQGITGRIAVSNLPFYQEVCHGYYAILSRVISSS